jgi:hypothetical protein
VNGILLSITVIFKNIMAKRLFSLISIILLFLLSHFKRIGINLIDEDLSFLFVICTITIGITNLIWNVMISKKV